MKKEKQQIKGLQELYIDARLADSKARARARKLKAEMRKEAEIKIATAVAAIDCTRTVRLRNLLMQATNTDKVSVSRWLLGIVEPRYEMKCLIADALGKTINELF